MHMQLPMPMRLSMPMQLSTAMHLTLAASSAALQLQSKAAVLSRLTMQAAWRDAWRACRCCWAELAACLTMQGGAWRVGCMGGPRC